MAEGWVNVARVDAVQSARLMEVEAGGHALLLIDLDGAIHATAAVCPHHQAWLSMGGIKGDVILCPRHAGSFDIVTGEQRSGPPCDPLRIYPVRIEDGEILVRLS